METTLKHPSLVAVSPRTPAIVDWTATALFCLQMGFPAYFRIALSAAPKRWDDRSRS